MSMVTTGSLGELEDETIAVLREQAHEISDGFVRGKHWLVEFIEQADALMRRRHLAEVRRRSTRT